MRPDTTPTAMLTHQMAVDFETCPTSATTLPEPMVTTVNTQDPYAGLNRAQRRKAIAVEARAFRKRVKRMRL